MGSAEARLAIVVALAENNGTKAINDTQYFLDAVAKIATFVLEEKQTDLPAPAEETPRGRKSKTEDKQKPDPLLEV